MRVSRRSFLGGAVGSLALLFGGFGWREPEGPFPSTREVQEFGERWGRGEMEGTLEDSRALNRLARAMVEERFPTDAQFAEMMKPPPPDFVAFRYEKGKKILITTEGIERDREILKAAFG